MADTDIQLELLFICASSADPYSVLLLDPRTGSSRWSYRGTELQSGKIRVADFLGEEQMYLCVALADKPIIVTVPVKQHKKTRNRTVFCTKSILNQVVNFFVSHPGGDFVFIASANKIYTWEVRHGQLLSIMEEHIREISALRISSCGNFLVSASLDGAVKIFLVASLITACETSATPSSAIRAVASHSAHSLPVNDLFIANGANPRVLSVSDDHSACLFSLATQQILLRITTDQALTACCMDPAETCIFIAAKNGRIRTVDIMNEFKSDFCRINQRNEASTSTTAPQNYEHHGAPVQKLCVNSDGTLLASGDQSGAYCIWDCSNGQCLRSGKMAGPINSLNFLPNCALHGEEPNTQPTTATIPLISSLQKQISNQRSRKVLKCVDAPAGHSFDEKSLENYFNSLLVDLNGSALRMAPTGIAVEKTKGNKKRRLMPEQPSSSTTSEDIICDPPTDVQSTITLMENEELRQRVAEVERELERMVHINRELYNYAANLAIDEEKPDNS